MACSSKKVRKTYLWMVQSVQIFGRLPKMTRVDNLAISFIEEDAWRLYHPYDNALVINMSIADFNTRWVLVDNWSSADILYCPAFQQMRIDKERLLPLDTPLVWFGGTKILHLFPNGLGLKINQKQYISYIIKTDRIKRKWTLTTHQTRLEHPNCYQTSQACYPTLWVYIPNLSLVQRNIYSSNFYWSQACLTPT